MKNTIVHHEGAASLKVAGNKIKLSGSIIKIGLDVHARLYVAGMSKSHAQRFNFCNVFNVVTFVRNVLRED